MEINPSRTAASPSSGNVWHRNPRDVLREIAGANVLGKRVLWLEGGKLGDKCYFRVLRLFAARIRLHSRGRFFFVRPVLDCFFCFLARVLNGSLLQKG